MKSKLLCMSLSFMAFFSASAQEVDENGYTTVELTTGPAYANRVFFDLSENIIVSQDAYNWDIAFKRISPYTFGTRINDAHQLEVYEASSNPEDWNSIDIANIGNWGEPLYNPDQTDDLSEGAFEQGSAEYGWGTYGGGGLNGTVIFVLKYPNDTYIKFFIESYFGMQNGYTFKYSKWDGTAWGEDITQSIPNGTNNHFFNYYSFTTDAVVANNEPLRDEWDLMFTRYWTFYNNIMMYPMAGVIQAPEISIAKIQPETQAVTEFDLPTATDYSDIITTIGHGWKGTSAGPAISDVVYYVKKENELYRLYFLTNGGQATGNMHFKYKNISESASTIDFENKSSFSIYPNPTVDKQVTLIYDITENASNGEVAVYSLSGQKVYSSQIANNSGFYQQNLDLSNLSTGVYIVKVQMGNYTANQKLVIK